MFLSFSETQLNRPPPLFPIRPCKLVSSVKTHDMNLSLSLPLSLPPSFPPSLSFSPSLYTAMSIVDALKLFNSNIKSSLVLQHIVRI